MIDKDKLLADLRYSSQWNEPCPEWVYRKVEAMEDEPKQPERKNGEWEEIEVIADAYDISGVKTWASKMKCDQCGFTTFAIEGHFSQYNFCPNCGSYNGGGEE